jgi:hypothetical protein
LDSLVLVVQRLKKVLLEFYSHRVPVNVTGQIAECKLCLVNVWIPDIKKLETLKKNPDKMASGNRMALAIPFLVWHSDRIL